MRDIINKLNEIDNVTLDEYNVIGSAVRLDEIPPKYRKELKFLGRGATTLAFEKDEKTVYVFTRDAMKKDWLMHGLHMVTNSSVIEPVRSHHIRGMSEIALWLIMMPKLYPLSRENRRLVVKELKDYAEISMKARKHSLNKSYRLDKAKYLNFVLEKYEEEHPNSMMLPLFRFLMDYNFDQYVLDLGARQFKQTVDGKIVLLDPIVDTDLMDLFLNHRDGK